MGSPTKLLNTKEMLTYLVSIVLMLAAPKAEAAECGVSGYHGSQHHRIVGGENAFRNEYPWQVLLLGEGMCGGTIISKNKILTAQHCTRGNRPSTFEVYVGVQNLEEVGNNFKRVCGLAEPDEYQYHPYHHDIAILTLCEELEFSESVRPICLPDSNDEKFTDDKAVATGWGRTSETGDISQALQTVNLKIYNNKKCNKSYRGISDWHICASAKGKDACQGDSGGPLAVKQNGRYTLVGVTSFGNGCARDGFPGVYARVSYFLDFINKNLD